MLAPEQCRISGCGYREVRYRAGKVEGGLNGGLKSAHEQSHVQLTEKGGGRLEHPQSGAADVIDSREIDHNRPETIAGGTGENVSQISGRGVGHSPFHHDDAHRSELLA